MTAAAAIAPEQKFAAQTNLAGIRKGKGWEDIHNECMSPMTKQDFRRLYFDIAQSKAKAA